MQFKAKQRGAALATVLIVVAVTTILLTQNMFRAQSITTQQNAITTRTQASEIQKLAEQHILLKLKEINTNQKSSELSELSLSKATLIDTNISHLPGWRYKVFVDDLQSRLNINQILQNAEYQKAFARLAEGYSGVQVTAINDWLDTDSEVRTFGAEDSTYMTRSEPYLASNQRALRASELRIVKGIDENSWKALKPHIAALPVGSLTNINSATEAVLKALAPNIDIYGVLSNREVNGPVFSDENEMRLSNTFAGNAELSNLFTLKSRYYDFEILITNERNEYRSSIRIDTESSNNPIIQRSPKLDIEAWLYADTSSSY